MYNYKIVKRIAFVVLTGLISTVLHSQDKYIYDSRGNLEFFTSDTLIARTLADTCGNDIFIKNNYHIMSTPYGLYSFGYSVTEDLNTGISFLNEIYVHGGVIDFAGLKNLITFFNYINDLIESQGDNCEYILRTGNIQVTYVNIADGSSPRTFTFQTTMEPIRSYNEYSIQRHQGLGQKDLYKFNRYSIEGKKGIEDFLNCLINLKKEIEEVSLISYDQPQHTQRPH